MTDTGNEHDPNEKQDAAVGQSEGARRYLELVASHGLDSPEVREFEREHRDDPLAAGSIQSGAALRAASRRARLWRFSVPLLWSTSAFALAALTLIATNRARIVDELSANVSTLARRLEQQTTIASSWGWLKPGVFDVEERPDRYLNRIAAALETDWEALEAKTDSESALAHRIAELRLGCTSLLFSDLEPLPEPTSRKLRDLCRRWSGHLDDLLDELEDGYASMQETKRKFDTLIHSMAGEIRALS